MFVIFRMLLNWSLELKLSEYEQRLAKQCELSMSELLLLEEFLSLKTSPYNGQVTTKLFLYSTSVTD